MLAQFTYPLVDLGLIKVEKGKYFFCNDASDWDKRLTDFYQIYLHIEGNDKDVLEEYFALPKDYFPGFYRFLEEDRENLSGVKGQVTGPLTAGLQVKDYRGYDSCYDETLFDIIIKTIAMEGAWQIQKLKTFQQPILISIDEPGLYACGSSSYISIQREKIQESLQFIAGWFHKEEAASGLHSCAGIDWSIPLLANILVLSFDAYNYFHTIIGYVEELNEFFQRGGILAWGLVPTSKDVYQESALSLFEELQKNQATLIRRGVDEEMVKNRFLITPSCGCGSLEEDLTRRIYQLTCELAQLARKNR